MHTIIVFRFFTTSHQKRPAAQTQLARNVIPVVCSSLVIMSHVSGLVFRPSRLVSSRLVLKSYFALYNVLSLPLAVSYSDQSV